MNTVIQILAGVVISLMFVIALVLPPNEFSGEVVDKRHERGFTYETSRTIVRRSGEVQLVEGHETEPAKYHLQVDGGERGLRWVTVTRMEFYKFTEGDKWPRN